MGHLARFNTYRELSAIGRTVAISEEDTIDIRAPSLVLLVRWVNVHLRRLRECFWEQERALSLYRRQCTVDSEAIWGSISPQSTQQ